MLGFPGGKEVKNPPANAGDAGDTGWIPGSGGSPGVRNGNPLQYSCLKNSMDRGNWWAIVHRVAESDTNEHIHNLICAQIVKWSWCLSVHSRLSNFERLSFRQALWLFLQITSWGQVDMSTCWYDMFKDKCRRCTFLTHSCVVSLQFSVRTFTPASTLSMHLCKR